MSLDPKASAIQPPRRNDLLPALDLVHRSPEVLIAPKRNVRAINPAHVQEVANSILALGFNAPVLIDPEGNILDGVVRVEAAKRLGLRTMPCVVANVRTSAEGKMLRLAINRLGEKGAWDLDALRLELTELVIENAPVEITGFELTEIDGILSVGDPASLEEGQLEPAPDSSEAVSRVGDVYQLGPHRLVCGDARDPAVLQRLMGEDKARFVFTDQPYNVPIAGHVTGGAHREFAMASGEMSKAEFDSFNESWVGTAARHLIDGGVLGTFIDWRGLGSVSSAAEAAGLSQVNLVVWGKTNAGMGSLYRSQHELLPLFKKGEAASINNVELGRKGRWRSNLWTYPGASSLGSDARRGLKDHPTVKPVAMLADALLDLTNRGEIVLDPFLGSGSTLIAAEKTGRLCRGIELDPLYVDVIVRRYVEVTGKPAILDETGETFEDLEARRRAEKPASTSEVAPNAKLATGSSVLPRPRLRPARLRA